MSRESTTEVIRDLSSVEYHYVHSLRIVLRKGSRLWSETY